jgi:hypothetical protein
LNVFLSKAASAARNQDCFIVKHRILPVFTVVKLYGSIPRPNGEHNCCGDLSDTLKLKR